MESLISSMHSETGKIPAAFVESIVGAQSENTVGSIKIETFIFHSKMSLS